MRTCAQPFKKATICFVAFSGVVCLLGCGGGPVTAPVHGKITYLGEPVKSGTVTFHPEAGGRVAVGQIGADGAYKLARREPGDEVLLGKYKVTIEAVEATNSTPRPTSLAAEMKQSAGAASAGQMTSLVPEKYSMADTSDLTATVEAGDNEIDFDL